MARVNLTDKFCRSPQRVPAAGRVDYHDGLVPGLALRVTEKGHRSFVLVARFPAAPKNPTRRRLGDFFPEPKGDADEDPASGEPVPILLEGNTLTLEQARQKARLWIALVQRGVDPKVEKDRQRAAALRTQKASFEHVAQQFLRRYVKGAAYCELERLAAELRKTDPHLKPTAALRQVMSDPAHAALVAKSRKEGLVKKATADSIVTREFIARWG